MVVPEHLVDQSITDNCTLQVSGDNNFSSCIMNKITMSSKVCPKITNRLDQVDKSTSERTAGQLLALTISGQVLNSTARK